MNERLCLIILSPVAISSGESAGIETPRDQQGNSQSLSRVADLIANHACKNLNSMDNITVQILQFRRNNSEGSRGRAATPANSVFVFANSRRPSSKAAVSRGPSTRGGGGVAGARPHRHKRETDREGRESAPYTSQDACGVAADECGYKAC